MIKLRDFYRAFERRKTLASLIPPKSFITDSAFYMKTGSVGLMLGIPRGIDSECMTDQAKDYVSGRLLLANNLFGTDVRDCRYLFKRRSFEIPGAAWNQKRIDYLKANAKGGTVDLYQSIECIIPFSVKTQAHFDPEHKRKEYAKALRRLEVIAKDYTTQTSNLMAPYVLPKAKAFSVLQRIIAPGEPARALGSDQNIDWQLSRVAVTWDHKRECLRLARRQARVFTLRIEPTLTAPDLLGDLLKIDADMLVASTWNSIEKPITIAHLKDQRNLACNLDTFTSEKARNDPRAVAMLENDPGLNQVGAINAALTRHVLEAKHYSGWYAMTIILHGELNENLDDAGADLKKLFVGVGAELLEEFGTPFIGCVLPEFFGVLPGAKKLQLRPLRLENHHYADLSLIWNSDTGQQHSDELDTDYANVYETRPGPLFYVNTHYRKRAMRLITGESGAGKSVFEQDYIQALLNKDPLLYILDVGGSYEELMREYGGHITRFTLDDPPQVNPFAIGDTPDGIECVFQCVRTLAETGGFYKLHLADHDQLYRRIRSVFSAEPEDRRLGFLRNICTGDLRIALSRWCRAAKPGTPPGQYGPIFDNVEDKLDLGDRHLFEFVSTTKGQVPDYVEPLKGLILYRIAERVMEQRNLRRPKYIVMDEAQIHTDRGSRKTEAVAAFLQQAIETLRKHNGMLSILTPDVELLGDMAEYVIKGTSSWIFFSDPKMPSRVLRDRFQFDEKKIEIHRSLSPTEFLFVADGTWKVLKLTLDDRRTRLFTTSPRDRADRYDRAQEIAQLTAKGA